MWNTLKDLLGFTSHDMQTMLLCMLAGLIGAGLHIAILVFKSRQRGEQVDGMKLMFAGYAFVGVIIGLGIGFLGAGILKESAAAVRTVLAISMFLGWRAHHWFGKNSGALA